MRVISGKFGGRRLKGPRGHDLRPTGDRLKQSLFDILSGAVTDAVFLDVFAGTGAIGIEAISRGAREVVFVESNGEALKLIRQNLELCGVASGYDIRGQDAFSALRLLGRSGFSADVIFFDPPYDFEPYRDLLDIVFRMRIAGPNSRCIIEHRGKQAVPEGGAGYGRSRVVRQGDKCLSFYLLL